MAKGNSAVTQLQDQIESIRRDAYNEGYSAAMRAVSNFAKQPTAEPQTRSVTTRKSPAKAPAKRAASTRGALLTVRTQATPAKGETASRAPRQRMGRRGENGPLIEAALKSLPNHTGRAGDIRKAIKEQHETELAFTSIRNALGQLQKDSRVTLDKDGKTWSLAAAE
jgi:type II secretory pathway component HofQ